MTMYNQAILTTIEAVAADLTREYPEIFRLGMDLVQQHAGVAAYERKESMIGGVLNGFAFVLSSAKDAPNNKLTGEYLKHLHQQTSPINSRLVKGIFLGAMCPLSINNADLIGIKELLAFKATASYKIYSKSSRDLQQSYFSTEPYCVSIPKALAIVINFVFRRTGIIQSDLTSSTEILTKTTAILTHIFKVENDQLAHKVQALFLNIFPTNMQEHLKYMEQPEDNDGAHHMDVLEHRRNYLSINLARNIIMRGTVAPQPCYTFMIDLLLVYAKAITEFKLLLESYAVVINHTILQETTMAVLKFMLSPTISGIMTMRENYTRANQIYNLFPVMRPSLGKFGVIDPRCDTADKLQLAVSTLVTEIIANYNTNIDQCADNKHKLSLIVKTITNLEQIHPFQDFNCRTICIELLNYLLLVNNLPPALLNDPNNFDACSNLSMVQQIKDGQQNFQDLIAVDPATISCFLQTYNCKPTTEEYAAYPPLQKIIADFRVQISHINAIKQPPILTQYAQSESVAPSEQPTVLENCNTNSKRIILT